MLRVNEIFHSIQGESTFAGCPCVFVRLTGCNLRCSWCDTPYAFTEGQSKPVDDVVRNALAYGCTLVEITGGEPLIQEEVHPLMDRLTAGGCTVLLETGGHMNLARVPPVVVKIMDVKCPASGEVGTTDWTNLEHLGPRDEVKCVIQDREDYEYARQMLGDHQLDRRCRAVLFSPVHGVLEPRTLARWVLADRLAVRVQLQVHKYLWAPETRGV
jgi:7-carboxy-7-deazaguanine synthase